MNLKKILSLFALFLAALLWGMAFSAQRSGGDMVMPPVFNTIRSFIGVIALMPVIISMDFVKFKRVTLYGKNESPAERKKLWIGGIWCGIALGSASLMQQTGLLGATAWKSGFITALYIIIVPILGIFLHRKTSLGLWLSALLALGGSMLLCKHTNGVLTIDFYDVMLFGGAIGFAIHILVIDHFCMGMDCVRLSAIQFFVAGLVSLLVSLILPHWSPWEWENIVKAAIPLLYCGIASNGIAFTLQTVAQEHVPPVAAAILMSLESVFAAVGGWMILNESLTGMEILGCTIIFIAAIGAQVCTIFTDSKKALPGNTNSTLPR